MRCDHLWTNARLATMVGGRLGLIENGVVAARHGRIVYAGTAAGASELRADAETCCEGRLITPGLIDCHTHIVHAGNRSGEFEARLNGASYEDIARAGGGIMATVYATRAAGDDALLGASVPRVLRLLAEGATTIEIKSGYGLTHASEAAMLRTARRIGAVLPVRVATTFLGAHALPPEYAGRPDAYIDDLCAQVLPALAQAGLVDAVDAFCERIAFTPAQTARVFDAAARLDLPVKLHAEQLSDQGGAALVARYGGLSADNLEHVSAAGIAAMAGAGTVAVLLPGAYYFLRETQAPPIAARRAAGVPMALATDCNPGTSPLTSLLLALNMACTLWRMTPAEALAGATVHAARALGLQNEIGTLAVGKRADFALWDIARPADLAYAMGLNPCRLVVNRGVPRAPVVSWHQP